MLEQAAQSVGTYEGDEGKEDADTHGVGEGWHETEPREDEELRADG